MHDSPDSTGTGPSTPQALLAFRIIGASMGLGVTLFAFVSWFLHLQSPPTPPDIDPGLAFNVWLAVALTAIVAAILFWRARVAPLIEGQATPAERTTRAGEVQTNVIITWALLEGPALMAIVIYFLYDHVMAGLLGVILIWVGLALTWPQREWFGA